MSHSRLHGKLAYMENLFFCLSGDHLESDPRHFLNCPIGSYKHIGLKGMRTDRRTDKVHGDDNSLQPNWLMAKK